MGFRRGYFKHPFWSFERILRLRSLRRPAKGTAASIRGTMPPCGRFDGSRQIRRGGVLYRFGRSCGLTLLLLGAAASHRNWCGQGPKRLVRNRSVSITFGPIGFGKSTRSVHRIAKLLQESQAIWTQGGLEELISKLQSRVVDIEKRF